MKDYKNDNRTSQEIDEERIVQTNSNLGLVDARPGESTLQTGTKNHSTKLDHAYSITDDLQAEDPKLELSTDDLKKTLELKNEDLNNEDLNLDTEASKTER